MRHLRFSALLLLMSAASHAAETASFLNVGVGARAVAMGGAFTAIGDDANALYWNPAGLSALKKREASTSHAELTQSSRHDYLGYAHPTAQGTVAGGVTYLSHGAINGRDAVGRPTGDFEASDTAISLGYGRKSALVNIGVAVKYIRSHIASAEAQSFAVDAGLQGAFGALIFGAVLRNVGPGLKYDTDRDDLPLRLALGTAYKLQGGHTLAAELINGPRGTGTDGSFGGEYQALKNIYVRAGFSSQNIVMGGSGFEAARGLALGMGFKDERWELSYAALPMGELGSIHRFTLGARF